MDPELRGENGPLNVAMVRNKYKALDMIMDAAETLGHSPYLLMRANQFVFMKYGKSDVSDNENPDEDAASVEEDYNVDIVNSEADLGI